MTAEHLVVSADGTQIACERSGSGPPLVLVHGTAVERFTFRFVGPLLAERFTLYAVDRRGRGKSGDSVDAYAIELEFADIAAVVDSLDEPADVFGHSYGATVALGGAPLTEKLRRLILYEPAPGVPQVPSELRAKLDALLAENKRDELVSTFFAAVGLGPDELEQLRASPVWAPRVEAAHTIPREIRAEEGWKPDPGAFATLTTPVTLLVGSESPDWAKQGTEIVDALLPNSRVVELEGQGHVATLTAPELVADEVARFLGA